MNDYYAVQTRARARGAGVSFAGFLERLDPAMAERFRFLGSFLREPARVGSFVPSSPALAQAMLRGCDLRNARTVVEFGAGTGAFTRLILAHAGRLVHDVRLCPCPLAAARAPVPRTVGALFRGGQNQPDRLAQLPARVR